MKDGNWIAIDKNLAKHFPDRKYSEIEAAFSLTLDYDNDKEVTVSGYAKLWQWSRSKVRGFLAVMGIEIMYPEDTIKNQKQKGQIKRQIMDRSEFKKGQIRMVDTKVIGDDKDRLEFKKGQIIDRSKDSTSKPINNPTNNTELIVSVVECLNKKLGTNYKPTTEKTKTCINARINEGNQLEQFKIVIDKKYNQWFGTDDAKYLRPETLFGNKFEGYLNQLDYKKVPTVKKLSLEKFKEAIQYKIDNQKPGQPFKFKNQELNKIIEKHPMISDYSFDSIKFDLAFKEYQKL